MVVPFRRSGVYFALLALMLLLNRCISGKAAYEQGNYVAAVLESVERLRSNPDNKKAREVLTLSYPEAVKFLDAQVENAAASASPDRWRIAVENYTTVNSLYETIRRSPAALRIIPQPQERFSKLAEARQHAAEEHYQDGLAAMLKGTRNDSKTAYRHFSQALSLVPEYKDALEYANQAKEDATLHVVVEPVRINRAGWEMEQAIFGYRGNEFVRFLTPAQVRSDSIKRIDQYLELAINGYSQSMPSYNRKTSEMIDSVKTGEKKVNQKVIPVMTAVKAKVTTVEKSITASASAFLRVADAANGQVIGSWEIPAAQRWTDQWAIYTGDIRALPKNLKLLTERKETVPAENQLRNMVRQELERKLAGQVAEFYRSF